MTTHLHKVRIDPATICAPCGNYPTNRNHKVEIFANPLSGLIFLDCREPSLSASIYPGPARVDPTRNKGWMLNNPEKQLGRIVGGGRAAIEGQIPSTAVREAFGR